MWAAAKGQVENIKLLVKASADVNRTTQKGFTPLMFALASGNPEAPVALIEAGSDITYTAPDGTSMVQMAMYRKQYGVAEVLINRGADLSAYDRNGNLLLHAAVLAKQPQLVSLLLEKGANPNALTGTSKVVWRYEVNFTSRPYVTYPKSPLFLAVERGAPQIMKMLVAAGADTKFRIDDGTNLVLAAVVSDPATLEQAFLLAPDMNVTNKRGQTPLLSLMLAPPTCRSPTRNSMNCLKFCQNTVRVLILPTPRGRLQKTSHKSRNSEPKPSLPTSFFRDEFFQT